LIGTNDLGAERSPEMAAEGVRQILAKLAARWPRTRILLLGLLPRGRYPTSRFRDLIPETNRLIQSCADGRRIVFLDLGPSLLDAGGELPPEVSPDRLHLSAAGYGLIVLPLDAALDRLLAGE
jgi:lysophospholipase L1-like esterase